MPRPTKQGLDYFPLNVDFFQDKKIRRVKSEYGADGITIYIYLLCEIYRNGYYVIADNDFILSMADDLKMSVNKINQVLRFLLGRSLFDDTLFRSDTVLTSVSVQRRYLFAVKERIKENNAKIKDFWLLESTVSETPNQVRQFSEISQEKSAKERKRNKTKTNVFGCVQNLSKDQRTRLEKEYGIDLVNEYINKTMQYKCCNFDTIKKWIEEDRANHRKSKDSFDGFCKHAYSKEDIKKLEKTLVHKNLS